VAEQLGEAPKKVLDIGCGAGFLSNELAQAGHEVSGIDQSEESLKIARKYDGTKSAHYQLANAYALPFSDRYFDVVCAMDFLEHVEDPGKVIAEASRVLKPGGIFFFHTFNKNLLAYFVIIKLVEWLLPKTPKNLHLLRLFITPRKLEQMCSNHGLKTQVTLGLRPNFATRAFWASVFSRKIHKDFRFSFTGSTLLSYMGYARRE
jgi:2-polyprenyl-6-hydroxyphenyl methylase/3-demethylubiquinone-9 3-methyltransferase